MPKENCQYEEYMSLMPELCLFDDLFMTVCFDNDPAFAEQILRIIMDNEGLCVLESRAQVDLKNLTGRSVRFDVKAVDEQGHPINIEIQRDSSNALPQRARYHSSMLDTVTLKKNQDFKDLPDCYVIFITEHDALGKKLPIYHIDRVIKETSDDFNDGSRIIYVNGANRDDTPLGKLMHDFSCAEPEKMYYNRIADKISYFKQTEEGTKYMSSLIDKIRTEGEASGKKAMVINMLTSGKYPLDEIAELSGFSVEEVKALQAKLAASARA